MRKNLLFYVLVLLSVSVTAQNRQTRAMLNEIEGQWELDDNGNVTYVRIVEAEGLTQDEIYNRVQNYFVYNYGSGKSVIQTQDPDLGTLVGKGLYDDVHIGVGLVTTYVDTWHIARVDVKEARARIILTLTEYEKKVTGGSTPPSYSTTRVADEFPINPKGMFKNVMGKAFANSHASAISSLDRIEKAIKEGNTTSELENDDW
jgi:hypothetical protein